MLSLVASWLTPAALFIFLNLVIGTIALTSRFTNNRRTQQHHQDENHYNYNYYQTQLTRTPSSLLERVRSINFSFHKFSPEPPPLHTQEPENYENVSRVERRPSFLERVKSINFSYFDSLVTEPRHGSDLVSGPGQENPTLLERRPSFLERVKSINLYSFYSPETEPEHGSVLAADQGNENSTQIERKPSFLERVKSIKFSSFTRAEPDPDPEHENGSGLVPGSEEHREVRRAGKMKKSASERAMDAEEEEEEEVERRRPATVRVEKTAAMGVDDEEVDAKADDFINRFKHQLKLQRLDSLLRYRDVIGGKHQG